MVSLFGAVAKASTAAYAVAIKPREEVSKLPRKLRIRRLQTHRLQRRQAGDSTRGYALTIFRGNAIRRIPIRLVSSLPDYGVAGLDLILARAFGDLVDFYGGVPYGSSGSPVYIGGKLIGAISATFYPDSKLVGITPATAMQSIAGEPGMVKTTNNIGSIIPSPARVTVAGLTSERALGEISDRFGRPLPGRNSPAATGRTTPRLQAGSALGAALLMGDIKLGFIGTATIVDTDQVYAFGHALLFSGPTNLPLTTAQIADTARGDSPDKIGTLGEVVGVVLQDRAAGIYARLGQPAATVPLRLSIRDEDRNRVERLQVQAAPLPSELPFLVYIAALEGLQRAMNRVGAGSAVWDWSIQASDQEPVLVSGGTYDPYDIAGAVSAAILPTLEQMLQSGDVIQSVELTASVTMRRLPELEE